MNRRILGIIVLVLCTIQIQPQVLGIDFGTQFWKASLISPGKNLLIVENSRSERKTLNSIAFDQGLRFFESESLFKRLKKPKASHFYLNRYIRSLDQPNPLPDYQFQNGTYLIQSGDVTMTLEQVVAQILRNLKSHASHQAGTDIKDCVITVPANWGRKARLSLINAAYLADLSVLTLVNENSAAMINFVITRNDTEPINMVVFNYGSSNLQISVMKLWGHFDEQKNKTIQSLQALSHVVVNDIGGLAIDRHIANYLADEFTKIHKIDPRSKERSMIKLMHKCSDAKEVLSANKETKVYVQDLIQGIDLQIPLKREIIENISFFDKFSTYIGEALDKAGLAAQDISFVELIGGSSRIKRVINIVKQYFPNKEVGAHMNGDEAMAFGSALRAANLSRSLRVKPLYFSDIFDFQSKVAISSLSGEKIREETLFTADSQHGQKKSITWNTNEKDQDLKISIYGANGDMLKEYTTSNLTDWKDKVKDENLTSQPTTTLNFVASAITIADLKEASVTVNMTTFENRQIEVDAPVQQEKKQEKEEGQEKSKEKEQLNREQVLKMFQQSKNAKKIKKNISLQVPSTKKHMGRIQQTYSMYQRLSKDQIKQKQLVIQEFQQNEKKIKEKAKIRNDFQSNLYRLKAMFEQEGGIKQFSTEEEWSNLQVVVTRQIAWLDQNAWTTTKEELEAHFKQLYLSYESIYNRTVEYQEREKTYNLTIESLSITYQRTQQMTKTHSWVEEQAVKLMGKINDTAKWLNDQLTLQYKSPLNENPKIYNHQYLQKADKLRDQAIKLRMTPQPKAKANVVKPEQAQVNQNADQTINLDDEEQNQESKQEPEEEQQQQNQAQEEEDQAEDQNEEEQKKEDL